MPLTECDVFTASLREICRADVLAEKWLLAPSLRVGFQWLDAVTRRGTPALNVRVMTMQHWALELAAQSMHEQGVTFLRGRRTEILIDQIFAGLRANGRGYLTNLEPSPGLTQTLCRTIRDLRLAGLTAKTLRAGAFEVKTKGREITALLSAYEQELQTLGFVDYADVLRLAAERVKNETSGPANEARNLNLNLILLAEDTLDALGGLERAFWDAVPEQNRKLMRVDQPGKATAGDSSDAALLRWIAKPDEAPPPKADGTAQMFRAVGEVNEVREVLRRCVAARIPFDEVEILHTDTATYVPLIYELASRLQHDDDQSIPVTFAEGIPTRYSRPGRALMGWLSWMRQDYPQSVLVRLIQDGLLQMAAAKKQGFSFARLSAMLRAVPVNAGRAQYITAIDQEVAAFKKRLGRTKLAESGNESAARGREQLLQRIEGLKVIRTLVAGLFAVQSGDGQKALLEAAAVFLETYARCVSQFDLYSRRRLLDEIRELVTCLDENVDVIGLNVHEWLADLPRSTLVAGQGPRPGHIYLAPLHSGGHSRRRHTFIVGLDDTRFPGAGLQDPLLLDGERGKLSDDLPTARGQLAQRVQDFARLLARQRGQITLGYCCRSLTDDREMFPSPVVLSAYRILSGNREGDQKGLLKWLPAPASFAPSASDRCIDPTEWWLWRLCGDEAVKKPDQVIAQNFPHLGRGFKARQARASNRFTEYDGYVPEAGQDFAPTKPDGQVLSASRLATLGACPMEYFLRYILKIEPPEEYEADTTIWIDPPQKGQLLHAVFRDFMAELHTKDLLPDFKRDAGLLQAILDTEIQAWHDEQPAPSRDVFERDVRELKQTAMIFLREEQLFCGTSRPICFEASLGLPVEGSGTFLDTSDPIEIKLPGGTSIRSRGRIDRVDEVPGSDGKRYTIWDYKTGSSWGYEKDNPFRGGRRVQNILYLLLAESRLRDVVSPQATVAAFGYFFPSQRQHGERISWTSEQLSKGKLVIARLCEVIARGAFCVTDDSNDLTYSNYTSVLGDVESAVEATKRKLQNADNKALEPFRQLRDKALWR